MVFAASAIFDWRVECFLRLEGCVGLATEREPSIRAVWLGQELRALREAKKIPLRELSGYLGKVSSSLSRMESGHFPVREDEVIAYCDITGVKDPHKRMDLLTMCRDVGQRGWWDGYDGDVASVLMDRLWIESHARTIRSCDITYVHGLLQTPEYAAALMRVGSPATHQSSIDRWVEVRMARQHILTRHHPVQMSALIDVTIFRRLPGDRDAKIGQLDYLLEASHRANIEIRVIPADLCHGVTGPFDVLELSQPYPTVGYVATSAGEICIEGEVVGDLVRTYDRLLEASLDVQTSQEVIIAERNKL